MSAILLQADEILVKPLNVNALGQLIRNRVASPRGSTRIPREAVDAVLHRETTSITADWLERLKEDAILTSVQLSDSDRIGHLPQLVQDLVDRLRAVPVNSQARISLAAAEHGMLRYSQGYSIEMIVDESRLLQVSIFHALHNNLRRIDLSKLLVDVMTIADEVDSQLRQAIGGYLKLARSLPAA